MNRIFDITAASERVSTGGNGRGEITFTVTNTSRRPLRGQLRVKPLGSTKGEWLSLADESERAFSPNATQQVVVKVATPPGVPAGKYQFRLDAISIINPDDDFTEGPTIDFEVKATEAPKKAFPWRLIAASAGAAILIVILTWLLWPTGVEVPEVIGLDVGEAAKKIEDSKLKVEVTRQPNAEVAAGRVFAQEPKGKSEAEEGATITLLVAEQKAAEKKPAEPKVEGPIVVFEDNFDNGVKPGWSNVKVEMTPNGRTRFLGQFWNESVKLTLDNLPPHKTVTIKFDLYVINTWDGDFPNDGPDRWILQESQLSLIDTTFSNQKGSAQRFACTSGEDASNGCFARRGGAASGAEVINSLGFNSFANSSTLISNDSVYKIKHTIAHDRRNLALSFFGNLREAFAENLNSRNESWGLDNVRIEVQ